MKAFEKYRNAAVTTADTSQQLTFIFDEIIKLLHSAQKAVGEQDHATKFKALSQVIEVFYVLKSGVDPENEATKHLGSFYSLTIDNLEQLNIKAEKKEDFQFMIDSILEVRSSLLKEMSKR